ncbi:hypothetical protein U9M48_018590 [Paspalum notatum var. saurae]|uniref:Reverse transcriptase domain-containing protein n=1 Tax=Paspalum notatum var. saurae TaxID=547442 RepID=A0AAQ3WPX4_PASNO
MRNASEKSNGVVNHRWVDGFNEWVTKWGLVNPVLAKLDRIFVSTDWESVFPFASVKALDRLPSDHNPLVLDTGNNVSFVKNDLVDLLNEFHEGRLDIQRLNFAMMSLIPKTEDACNMKNFRPISLINCSFKIFSKLLTLRLGKGAFLKGRYILESVVIAHEMVHSVHQSKQPGLFLKLDFEKAYDRVSWNFLFEVLASRGFDPLWIKWIKMLVVGGSVGVCLNGEESAFFKPGKGLRQGDPISPLLFNLVGDVLAKMMMKAARAGLIKGLLTDFVTEGIYSLQYADDTIVFSSPEGRYIRNLKCILMWYERISGMRINFHKSEVLPLNVEPALMNNVSLFLGCPVGEFPLKYLGVPLHFDKLSREDVQPLVDKILKRIAVFRFISSFIEFPKWAIKCLNTHMSNFLWNDSEGRSKYHLANWESATMCRDFGGLGIPNLRDLNVCLLASWVKRYEADVGKLWREVIGFKYKTSRPNLFASKERRASQFFKGMLWAAKAARMGYRWRIGNGKRVKFWEDNWLGTSSLAIQFWNLYVLVNEKSKSVAELWDGNSLKCTFRRVFGGDLMRLWEEVLQLASTIVFEDEEDSLIWQFSSNGTYSSQSLYKVINFRGAFQVHSPAVWSLKIPPRVHFFLWLLSQNKVLTRDNLAKRREVSDDKCLFCCEKESVHHLFFECMVSRNMWKVVSEALGVSVENNFLAIGRMWLSNKKLEVLENLDLASCRFGSKLDFALSGRQKTAFATGGSEAEDCGSGTSEAALQEQLMFSEEEMRSMILNLDLIAESNKVLSSESLLVLILLHAMIKTKKTEMASSTVEVTLRHKCLDGIQVSKLHILPQPQENIHAETTVQANLPRDAQAQCLKHKSVVEKDHPEPPQILLRDRGLLGISTCPPSTSLHLAPQPRYTQIQ